MLDQISFFDEQTGTGPHRISNNGLNQKALMIPQLSCWYNEKSCSSITSEIACIPEITRTHEVTCNPEAVHSFENTCPPEIICDFEISCVHEATQTPEIVSDNSESTEIVENINSCTVDSDANISKKSPCKIIRFPGSHLDDDYGINYEINYEANHEVNHKIDLPGPTLFQRSLTSEILQGNGLFNGDIQYNDPHSDPLNYDRTGNYIGPPPDGYVWASTFKKDGMRKLVARNSYKGEEKKAYPIIRKEQMEAMASWLYAHKDKKYLLAFVLGINLGLRANELLSLRKHDLFLKDGTIRYVEDITDTSDHIRVYQKKTRNSKYSKYRNVFLNESCVNILNWYFPYAHSRFYTDKDIEDDRKSIETEHCRGGKDFIFPSSQKGGKKEMTVDSFRKVLEEASKACGLSQNIATHTIRKTFGIANGVTKTIGGMQIDVDKVQRLLGHSSGETTLRYLDTDQMNLKSDYHSCCLDVMGDLFYNASSFCEF